jgi:hypothetical protein
MRIFGLALAFALLVGEATSVKAQIAIRNPVTGGGVYIGQPWGGYGYGYSPWTYGAPGTTIYSSGYALPGTTLYSSGFYGGGYPAPVWGTGYYGYPAYRSYTWYGYGRPRAAWRRAWRRGWWY